MSGEYYEIRDSLPEIVAQTGVTHPNVPPYEHVSALIVAWNEEMRIGGLIELLKGWFTDFVVCVQKSTDSTLDIARALLPEEMVIEDQHWGHGDHSFPMMVQRATTPWCFVVSCDEHPDLELLQSIRSATVYAELDRKRSEGVWFRFSSLIEGIEVPEQGQHLRLFKRYVGWPQTLHSRPPTTKAYLWPFGQFIHDRSLDEMVQDYLRYYRIGQGAPQWDNHNVTMMRDACVFVAKRYGWSYVTRYDWWPQVAALAFPQGVPDGE